MGIIRSILDSDLYKFTMQHAIIQKFPNQRVRYIFRDRNGISYPDGFDKALMKELKEMEKLRLTKDEKRWMSEKLSFLSPAYLDFLYGYQFDSTEVNVWLDENNKLGIEIEGYWHRVVLWEVPVMSIISELYFKMTGQTIDLNSEDLKRHDLNKLQLMVDHNAYFADFGNRRRYSFDNQERVVKLFVESGQHVFVGTSNVYLAYKYDIKCIGTHAHEWFMTIAAIYGYKVANKIALQYWSDVYKGSLGTALTDTFTTDAFLKSFDMVLSKLFDGVRHDSGNPYQYADKMIEHYKKYGVDPMSKTIVFSNALKIGEDASSEIEDALQIKEYCVGKIKSSFGIGTYLTNDVGVKSLNIVLKISEVLVDDQWVSAIKISDDLGKVMGDQTEINICKHDLRIK